MAPRLTTDHRSERLRIPGAFRPDGSFEPLAYAGDWDREEWRAPNGHPHPMVQHAFNSGFCQAIQYGLSLADAIGRAEEEAAQAAREYTQKEVDNG